MVSEDSTGPLKESTVRLLPRATLNTHESSSHPSSLVRHKMGKYSIIYYKARDMAYICRSNTNTDRISPSLDLGSHHHHHHHHHHHLSSSSFPVENSPSYHDRGDVDSVDGAFQAFLQCSEAMMMMLGHGLGFPRENRFFLG